MSAIADARTASGRRVLVTGATGFIGRVVCRQLAQQGFRVHALVRTPVSIAGVTQTSAVGDLRDVGDFAPYMRNVDALVHLAALTHARTRGARTRDFVAHNADVSGRLATAASAHGVADVVFMSSIKVNGESSPRGHGLRGSDAPAPQDDYARSKLAAELAFARCADGAQSRVTILRPPLVYGRGQRGHLALLARAVVAGWPLPLAGLHNRRSLIYVEHLADAVCAALTHARPGVRAYTVADVDLSTPELVDALARALDVRTRMFHLPAAGWALLRKLPHLGPWCARLSGDLAVDSADIMRDLDWHPRVEVDAAFRVTCADLRRARPC